MDMFMIKKIERKMEDNLLRQGAFGEISEQTKTLHKLCRGRDWSTNTWGSSVEKLMIEITAKHTIDSGTTVMCATAVGVCCK